MTLPIGLASALFNTIVDTIKASPAVTAAIGNRIYDVPPEKAQTPYIFLGPAGFTPANDIGCGDAWRFTMRIYVITAQYGRLAAWDIGMNLAVALHEQRPAIPVPGFGLPMAILVTNGGDIVDPLELKEVFIDIEAVIGSDS